jgi:hypothetical protein
VSGTIFKLLVCLLLAGLVATGCTAGSGEAICVGPMLEAKPGRGAPGEAFRVHGEAFASGCNDTPNQPEKVGPIRNVRLVFRQGSQEWELATVDADRRCFFDVAVRVPPEAETGRATVVATSHAGDSWTTERFVVLGT